MEQKETERETRPPKAFEEYFAFEVIVRKLARMRAKLAVKRHSKQLVWRISEKAKNPAPQNADRRNVNADWPCDPNDICAYLPPRRYWVRERRSVRRDCPASRRTERAVIATIRKAQREGLEKQPWGRNLLRLVDAVQRRIAQPSGITIAEPRIHLISKGNDRWAMRCLASYENVADRLILSCACDYMRELFDGFLSDDCYAFRKNAAFSHRTAVEDLVNYRMTYEGKRLYVAECDIQKFFDVIHHDVVITAYEHFVQTCADANGVVPDARLRKILEAYLSSYSSTRNLAECEDPDVVAQRHLVKHVDETGVGAFYPGQDVESLPIGIPQGGALSPLIANIVLDAVDRAVAATSAPELFYARFCDDMILAHPKKSVCAEALDRYVKALESLKLPVHPVRKRVELGDDYYDTYKSKGPFLWFGGERILKSVIPWVSFLGVHVGFDGQVRIRQSTLQKHAETLVKERSAFMRYVGKGGRWLRNGVTVEDAMRAFEDRVTAIGVGYDAFGSRRGDELSWMAAFPRMTRCGFARNQMRKLDSLRGKIVSSVRRKLEAKSSSSYLGRPFSYYGYLMEVERHENFWNDFQSYSEW